MTDHLFLGTVRYVTSQELSQFLWRHQLDKPTFIYQDILSDLSYPQDVQVTNRDLHPFNVSFFITDRRLRMTIQRGLNQADDTEHYHPLGWFNEWHINEEKDQLQLVPDLPSYCCFLQPDQGHVSLTNYIGDKPLEPSIISANGWALLMNNMLFLHQHREQLNDATDIYRLLRSLPGVAPAGEHPFPMMVPTTTADLNQQLWHPR